MIFRTVKNTNYVCIHKGFLEDKDLTFRAKGLMTYCLSRIDNWEFHISHLQEVSKEGRDAVYSAIKELINKGYIVREIHREKGKFEKGKYLIYETPQLKPVTGNPDMVEPLTGNPDTVCPDTANPPLISNEYILSNENNNPLTPKMGGSSNDEQGVSSLSSQKNETKTKSKEATLRELKNEAEKIEVCEGVRLSQKEIEKTKAEYGDDGFKEMIEILSNYKLSTGKRYKSDYHAMMGWVKDRYLEKPKKVAGQTKDPEEVEKFRHSVLEFIKKHYRLIQDKQLYFVDKGNHVCIGNDKIYYSDEKATELIRHAIAKTGLIKS